jgi:hypothetical protein
MSTSNVGLGFSGECIDSVQHFPQRLALLQIGEGLSCNAILTSLSLSFDTDPSQILDLDFLLKALTSLQRLELGGNQFGRPCSRFSPAPKCIVNLSCLTHLCIGPGLHLVNLQNGVPRITQLRALHLKCGWEPRTQELSCPSYLDALLTPRGAWL